MGGAAGGAGLDVGEQEGEGVVGEEEGSFAGNAFEEGLS